MYKAEKPAPAGGGQDLPITKRTAFEDPSTAHAKRIKHIHDGSTELAPDITTLAITAPVLKPLTTTRRVAFPEKVYYHLYLGDCQDVL